jgi:hypothetical protein
MLKLKTHAGFHDLFLKNTEVYLTPFISTQKSHNYRIVFFNGTTNCIFFYVNMILFLFEEFVVDV